MKEIKGIKAMSAAAMSIQATAFFIERFVMLGDAAQTNKQWLNRAVSANEKAMDVFSALGFMETEEARKLKNSYWEVGTVAYQMFMNLSLLPPTRTEEYMATVETVSRPIFEQGNEAEEHYAKVSNLDRIDLTAELKERKFTTDNNVVFKRDKIQINLIAQKMEIFNGLERVYLGKHPRSEYELDLFLKMVCQ